VVILDLVVLIDAMWEGEVTTASISSGTENQNAGLPTLVSAASVSFAKLSLRRTRIFE
jgi:hypothetical protein